MKYTLHSKRTGLQKLFIKWSTAFKSSLNTKVLRVMFLFDNRSPNHTVSDKRLMPTGVSVRPDISDYRAWYWIQCNSIEVGLWSHFFFGPLYAPCILGPGATSVWQEWTQWICASSCIQLFSRKRGSTYSRLNRKQYFLYRRLSYAQPNSSTSTQLYSKSGVARKKIDHVIAGDFNIAIYQILHTLAIDTITL